MPNDITGSVQSRNVWPYLPQFKHSIRLEHQLFLNIQTHITASFSLQLNPLK